MTHKKFEMQLIDIFDEYNDKDYRVKAIINMTRILELGVKNNKELNKLISQFLLLVRKYKSPKNKLKSSNILISRPIYKDPLLQTLVPCYISDLSISVPQYCMTKKFKNTSELINFKEEYKSILNYIKKN